MAINPDRTLLDMNQILQRAFDQSNDKLRVDAVVSLDGTVSEVVISHTDDSIRLGDGTKLASLTTVGGKNGLDVNVINDIALDISHLADSIRLGDGTDYITTSVVGPKRALDVNVADGTITGDFTPVPAGITVVTHGATTVTAGATTTVATYTIPAGAPVYLQKLYLSGDSVGKFTIYKNFDVLLVVRLTHTNVYQPVDFATNTAFGVATTAGDTIIVEVENVGLVDCNFDATIQTMNT